MEVSELTQRKRLADQLRIERERPTRSRRTRKSGQRGPRWPFIVGAAILAFVALAWFLTSRPDEILVEVAVAKPAWTETGATNSTLLDADGYVVARREATVSAKISGKVARVLIQEGQHVSAGEVMAALDDSNTRAALQEAVAQASEAQAGVRVAEVKLNGAAARHYRSAGLPRGYVSDQATEDDTIAFETARENLALAKSEALAAQAHATVYQREEDDTIIRAPFSGVVTATAAQPGEIVAPVAGGGFTRTGICTIVDMDSLEVDVDVAESFIGRVTPGMNATVITNAYPDWRIPAQVITVIPTADRSKATVTVRIGLNIKDPRIIPEMGAHVAFLAPKAESGTRNSGGRAVIVPVAAIQTEESGQRVVFVVSRGHAERRPVRVSGRDAEGELVEAGLQQGDVVATGGAGRLKDGVKVRISLRPLGKKTPQ